MKDTSHSSPLRFLQGAACVVIILWGIRVSSSVLGPVLLGLILAYAVVPFPTWIMRRFKMSKRRATVLTVITLGAAGLLTLFTLEAGIAKLAARVPLYEQQLTGLYGQITALLGRFHGIDLANLSFEKLLTPERLGQMVVSLVPQASALASEVLLICLLAALFVMVMLPAEGVKPGALAGALLSHGGYARAYIAVTAKSAGINALINLAILLIAGVDTPILWCLLYFFFSFIPFIGPTIALAPPILLVLLISGWKTAALVAAVLIFAQLMVGEVLMPILAKKSMSISVLEITLSLTGWSFLLGLPGAIAAVPLTLVLKELVAKGMEQGKLAEQAAD
jgi:predicted PurR-regulated permease PerM